MRFFNFPHDETVGAKGQQEIHVIFMHNVDVHVGKRLRGRRTELGLSQEDVASRLGITFQQVQKYEKGSNGLSARRLQQLSKSLGVSVAYFFEGLGSGPAVRKEAEPCTSTAPDGLASERETLEMAKAFNRIDDRRVRRYLMALMRDLAGCGVSRDGGRYGARSTREGEE